MPYSSNSTSIDIEKFIQVEASANESAFGNNSIPTPTASQLLVGNYKKGRFSIYGLEVVIEQPRGTYRTGIGENGERWTSRMAAHYGYFAKTRGTDNDPVDVFIGPFIGSEHIFIINQFVNGKFDEHKCFIGYIDENTATRAYLDSYDKGWTGLQSIIKASITQFKWWLKNGNMNNAIALNHLPYEGFSTMNKQVRWGADSQPEGMTIAKLLYEIRRADGGENLLLDSVTMQDILENVDSLLAFDALVTPYAKLEQKMQILQRAMERKGGTVKVESLQISDPFKQSGVAQVAALFELSDGQTVSIFFHNPDIDPRKIQQGDELISWKWLLNKKDITIVVAPEQGKDLNPRVVAERIMNLAEKNSPAFVRANGKRAEKMQAIEDIKTEITGLEKELKDAQHELEVAKVEAEDRLLNPVAMAGELNPVSPEGYANIMTDPALQEQYQDVLDAFFQERIIAVRNALHKLGWVGGKLGHELFGLDNQLNLAKNGSLVHFEFINAGAGKNIIGVKYNEISDDLIKTPEQLAAVIDATTIADELNPTSPEGYAKIKGIGNMELRYQDVLDDFFQERIIAVRSALMDVGWSGVRQKGNYDLSKNGYVAKFNFKRVGAGANVVGYYASVMDGKDIQAEIGDMLTGTPADVAASIDAVITNAGRVTQANYPSQELDLTPASEITPDPSVEAFKQATLQSLIDKFGWTNQSTAGGLLFWVTKEIGGGHKGGMANPDGIRRVSAKIEEDSIVATHGDNVVARSPFDVGKTPEQNAGELDRVVNAIDPNYKQAQEQNEQENQQAEVTPEAEEAGAEGDLKDASDFVLAPDGSTDFGEITPDIAKDIKRQPGKIKLQVGEHLGKNKGYGIIHIKEGHPEIKNPIEFVQEVVSNFSEIWKTKNGRLILIKRGGDKTGDVSVVQLLPDNEEDFYSVVTSYKSRNPEGETLLWDATHSHPADSGIQPALQSDHHEASDEGESAEQKEDDKIIDQPTENAISTNTEPTQEDQAVDMNNEPETENEPVPVPADSDEIITPAVEEPSEVDNSAKEQINETQAVEDLAPVITQPLENPIKAGFEAELSALMLETDINAYDQRLDEIYARIEAAGLAEEMDAKLHETADVLTELLAELEKNFKY